MARNDRYMFTRSIGKYKTKWANKVGVFETPQGKWIVRVRKGKNKTKTTISQHDTKEEALSIYNELNNKL